MGLFKRKKKPAAPPAVAGIPAEAVLEDPEPSTFMVSWEAVESIVGGYLEPTAHWPERWRVSSFPTPAEIAQLRAFAQ